MFITYLKENKNIIDKKLNELMNLSKSKPANLFEAIRYSLLSDGKRIRPILIMAVMKCLEVDYIKYIQTICAIEYIHTYSLIHDDLPAMDDDNYRRGKLTNHKVYGEASAILAGDALLTDAFLLVSSDKNTSDKQKVAIIKVLSKYAGSFGMISGQMFDINSENKQITLDELEFLHSKKTGSLFIASIKIACILSNVSDEISINLAAFAKNLGLLFQLTDDMLDNLGKIECLGKEPGRDELLNKSTYVSILGLKKCIEYKELLVAESKSILLSIPFEMHLLESLIDYISTRQA